MKMIIELNATEAKNSVKSGALLTMLETLADFEKETEAPVRNFVNAVKKENTPVETVSKDEVKTSDAPKEISEVEIRAKFVELSKKGKRSELKNLLSELGVSKVSDIKPEQYHEAWAKLEAI